MIKFNNQIRFRRLLIAWLFALALPIIFGFSLAVSAAGSWSDITVGTPPSGDWTLMSFLGEAGGKAYFTQRYTGNIYKLYEMAPGGSLTANNLSGTWNAMGNLHEVGDSIFISVRSSTSSTYHFYELKNGSWSENTPTGTWKIGTALIGTFDGRLFAVMKDSSTDDVSLWQLSNGTWSDITVGSPPSGDWTGASYLGEAGGKGYFSQRYTGNIYKLYEMAPGGSLVENSPSGTWDAMGKVFEVGNSVFTSLRSDATNTYHFYELNNGSWSENTPTGTWQIQTSLLGTFDGKLFANMKDSSTSDVSLWQLSNGTWSDITVGSPPSGDWTFMSFLGEANGKGYFTQRYTGNIYKLYEMAPGGSLTANNLSGTWDAMNSLNEVGDSIFISVRSDANNTYHFYELNNGSWSENTPTGTWQIQTSLLGTFDGKLFANMKDSSTSDVSLWQYTPPVTLDVVKDGTGSGTVSSDPAGIACGATCSGSYSSGSVVTLTASAAADSTFTGWSGGATGTSNPIMVTMDAAKSVTATFALNSYPLTITASGTGSGSINKSPNSANYDHGTLVTLSATADVGSTFSGWSGSVTSTDNLIQVTMDEAKSITATFTLNSYSFTTASDGTGSGSINQDPTGTNHDYGTVVTLTATSNVGSSFTGWSGDATGTTNPITVTVDQAKAITATFTLNNYAFTTNTDGNGSGSINQDPTGTNHDYGSVVTLTATSNVGSSFTGWSGDAVGTTNPITVTVDRAKAITATFTLDKYTFTTATDGTGSGAINQDPAGTSIDHGTLVTLTATANIGSTFTGWSGDASGTTNPMTMTVDAAKSVTATFALNSYAFSTAVDGTGSGSISQSPAGSEFDYGTMVVLTATAQAGSTFTGWSGDAVGANNPITITIDEAKSITATFTLGTNVLTVLTDGSGSGLINSTPAGIDCGTTCASSFDFGTVITLTATANNDSNFTGWSNGSCSGSDICVVTLNNAEAVTANFALKEYPITTAKIGSGDGNIAISPVMATYPHGTVVTLTATADAGSTFSGWSGDANGIGNPITVTVDSVKSITGTFTLGTNVLTVVKNGDGAGAVQSSPSGIDCGEGSSDVCALNFNFGTMVILTATAAPGSTFTGWSNGACSGMASCQVLMNAAQSVTVTFEKDADPNPLKFKIYLPIIISP